MNDPNTNHTEPDLPTQEAPGEPPHPFQDMMTCLIPALLAALPAFLDAFFTCIRGENGQSDHDYRPGNRQRCP